MTRKKAEFERHRLFYREDRPPFDGAKYLQPFDVCKLCGTPVKGGGRTNNVLGKSAHIAKHIRNGDLVEETRTRTERYTVYVEA